MDNDQDLNSEGTSTQVKIGATVAVAAAVTAVSALGYAGVTRLKLWRHDRKMRKIQEEYNKIYDEWKYYQGEASAE